MNAKNELILVYRLPWGKAGGLQILRCKGIAVNSYSFSVYVLTLKPSGFCNVGDDNGQYDQQDFNSIHKPPAVPVRIEKVLPLLGDHGSLI